MFRLIPRRLLIEPRAGVVSTTAASDRETTVLRIDGLVCSACAAKVRRRLERLPGVTSADVDLTSGEALVRSGSEVDTNALMRAVEGAVVLPSLRRLLARLGRRFAKTSATGCARRLPVWPASFQ